MLQFVSSYLARAGGGHSFSGGGGGGGGAIGFIILVVIVLVVIGIVFALRSRRRGGGGFGGPAEAHATGYSGSGAPGGTAAAPAPMPWSGSEEPAINSVRGDLFPGSDGAAHAGTSPVQEGLAEIKAHDPAFNEEATRTGTPISGPLNGEELTALIERAYATNGVIVERARALVGAP